MPGYVLLLHNLTLLLILPPVLVCLSCPHSCWHVTWLAWRPLDAPDSLLFSKPFMWDSKPPTTAIAALSWLQDLVMQRTVGQGLRHARPTDHLGGGDSPEEGSQGQASPSTSPDDGAKQHDPTDEDDDPAEGRAGSRKRARREGPGNVPRNRCACGRYAL